MKASEWVWNEASFELNKEALLRKCNQGWEVVQRGSQYAATGITIPGLKEFVYEVQGRRFSRNHWCVGATAIDERDFEVGSEDALGMYVGIRIHEAGGTPTQRTHEMVYDRANGALSAITTDVTWKHRRSGGFWSIYADVPTARDGQILGADEYLEMVIELSFEGWLAVKDLWASSQA